MCFVNAGTKRCSEHRSQSFTATAQFCLACSKKQHSYIYSKFCQNINGSLGVIGSKYEMENENCLSSFGDFHKNVCPVSFLMHLHMQPFTGHFHVFLVLIC